MIEDTTLRERIDDRSHSVDNAYWAINSNRESDVIPTTAFRSLGLDCLEIASCELQLGNVDTARQWFARAAFAERSYVDVFSRHFDELRTSNQNNGSTRALLAIEDALLSGDSRLIEITANEVLNLSDDYATEYGRSREIYYEACMLASLSKNNNTAVRKYKTAYEDVVEEPKPHSIALMDTYDGFLADDASAVQTALQEMVDYHAESTDDLSRWLELMSPAVGALFLIARDRGMDITVDSWYLPGGLTTYGLTDQIDLPRPDYLREELLGEE
jgi:hypothetical protein